MVSGATLRTLSYSTTVNELSSISGKVEKDFDFGPLTREKKKVKIFLVILDGLHVNLR